MELFEAFRKRHSYRGPYLKRSVPRVDLEKIVEAGIQAPSGCNAQTTSFVIVDDPQILAQIAEVLPKACPAMIICIVDPTPAHGATSYMLEDCAAAVENMFLAITALGYASVWLDGVLRRNQVAETIREILGVPEGKRVQIVLPVGIPEEQGVQNVRKPFVERAWFNRYGG